MQVRVAPVRADGLRSAVFMNRLAAAGCLVAVAFALASAAARAQESAATDAEWKEQLLLAHQVSNARGICEAYTAFKRWQLANWPEGQPAVARLFDTTVLPNFLQDRSLMKDRTPAQVEEELLKFCTQAVEQAVTARNAFQAIADGQAGRQPTAEEHDQAIAFRDSLDSATFRGECKTVSPLYRAAPEAEKETIQRFVYAEIYGKDDRYRQQGPNAIARDDDSMDDVAEFFNTFKQNRDREGRYWSDCDSADARFQSVIEQLTATVP